jgi:hypothetical protein
MDRSLEDLIDSGASAVTFVSQPPIAALMIDAADKSNRSPP